MLKKVQKPQDQHDNQALKVRVRMKDQLWQISYSVSIGFLYNSDHITIHNTLVLAYHNIAVGSPSYINRKPLLIMFMGQQCSDRLHMQHAGLMRKQVTRNSTFSRLRSDASTAATSAVTAVQGGAQGSQIASPPSSPNQISTCYP